MGAWGKYPTSLSWVQSFVSIKFGIRPPAQLTSTLISPPYRTSESCMHNNLSKTQVSLHVALTVIFSQSSACHAFVYTESVLPSQAAAAAISSVFKLLLLLLGHDAACVIWSATTVNNACMPSKIHARSHVSIASCTAFQRWNVRTVDGSDGDRELLYSWTFNTTSHNCGKCGNLLI